MKSRIDYTLLSSDTVYYLEQALLSAYSVRLHNTSARIEFAVDEITFQPILWKRDCIKKFVDTISPIKIPEGFNKIQKSRYLKTIFRTNFIINYRHIKTNTDDFYRSLAIEAKMNKQPEKCYRSKVSIRERYGANLRTG